MLKYLLIKYHGQTKIFKIKNWCFPKSAGRSIILYPVIAQPRSNMKALPRPSYKGNVSKVIIG